MVAWPQQPPPPSGYPVLFLTDAHTVFGTAVEAARLQAGRPAATGVAPGVVVGLGHEGDRAALAAYRRRDYTPPPFDPDADTGGGGDFLHAIETQVLPDITDLVFIDRTRMALFGHSLGGLLPILALLTRPGLFAHHIAASPSLWWADGALLRQAHAFALKPRPTGRLLLTVGGLEHAHAETARGDPARAARMRQARMIDNLHELAACLSPVVPTQVVEFPGENHGSVLPAAVSRAMPFAFGPASSARAP